MSQADSLHPSPPVSHQAPRWLRVLRYGALAGVLLLGGFIAGYWIGHGRAGPPPLADLGPAPHYKLVNQLGQPVASQRFAGKVQIVTFIFPYCTTYCPLIAAHLIGFEHLLTLAQTGLQNKVAIVAFNIAPKAADQKAMREFLQQYGWDPKNPRWQFLTGTPAQIRNVVTKGYHISYQRVADTGTDSEVDTSATMAPQLAVANPLAEKVKPGFDISHNDAIVIVDPNGRIRKIYDDADVVPNQQLLDDIMPLLKAG